MLSEFAASLERNATPEDALLELANGFSQFGVASVRLYHNSRDVRHLHMGVAISCLAVNSTPRHCALLPSRLYAYAEILLLRFRRLYQPPDLDPDLEAAISSLRRAVDLAPVDGPEKPRYLSLLGLALLVRFEEGDFDGEADIQEAARQLRYAIDLTHEDHPGRRMLLNHLGTTKYHARYRLGKESTTADIENSLSAFRQSLEHMPDNHPDRANILSDYGKTLCARFRYFNRPEDIEEAIRVLSLSNTLMAEDEVGKSCLLTRLSNAFQMRYGLTTYGSRADIDDAVSMSRKAVMLTTPDDHDAQLHLSTLGDALYARFKKLGEADDIDEAISVKRHSLGLMPDDHPDKGTAMYSLVRCLHSRFEQSKKIADLDDTIAAQRLIIELTSDYEKAKPGDLNQLGIFLRKRFQQFSQEPYYGEEAIRAHRRALELTPDTKTHVRSDSLHNLGLSWSAFLAVSRHPSHFTSAYESFIAASRMIQHGNNSAMVSAASAVKLCESFPDFVPSPSATLYAHRLAIEAISGSIPTYHKISARYEMLTRSRAPDSIVAAASAAIVCDEFGLALEWLEQARSLIWTQLLRLRSPLHALRICHRDLADEFENAAREIESAGHPRTESNKHLDSIYYFMMEGQYEKILARIRAIKGFEDFLHPRKASGILSACQAGPVVVIVVHRTRCDALALFHPGKVTSIPLPQCSLKQVAAARSLLLGCTGGRSGGGRTRSRGIKQSESANDSMRKVLRFLWNCIVQPILMGIEDELKASKRENQKLPHITWCTTGPLAFLPLHAAGIYNANDPLRSKKASDFIVSSYTTSLEALITSLRESSESEKRLVESRADPQVLVVSQPDTPALNAPLPFTIDEAARIREHFAGGITHLDHTHATVEAVVEEMKKCEWVHLACHGIQPSGDPSQSAFYLYNGNLDLVQLMCIPSNAKELAVLSACQTATGDERLPEEAVHLAGGMLAAGFRSVVATIWSIVDEDCPDFADALYGALKRRFKSRSPGERLDVAYAVHEAAECLRKKVGEGEFARWVPFVHFGA